MATNLIFVATLRTLSSNVGHCLIRRSKVNSIHNLNALGAARLLHIKILDKETGWDTQREANKHRPRQEAENATTTSYNKYAVPLTQSFVTNEETTFQTKPIEAAHGYKINENPEVFGSTVSNEEEDAGDLEEEEYISNPPTKSRRLDHIHYVRMIKEHLRAKQLKEAIQIVEQRMRSDRVQPETYTYNLLISACGKAGYTRKAFSLFTRMRQRGLRVTGGTYTSLFNACANAPSADDAIGRANHVREIMLEKGVEPNIRNYNAMIKAYGRWGDVKTAYQLADEMVEKKFKLTAETYNFLLQASASDRKFGFRHCLLTWHKMRQSGINPDYFSFKMVLRCVRDCEFGDLESMQEVLVKILGDNAAVRRITEATASTTTNKVPSTPPMLHLSAKESQSSEDFQTATTNPTIKNKKATNPFKDIKVTGKNAVQITSLDIHQNTDADTSLEIPNLLAPQPHIGSMMALSEVKQPHERFLLLGGITGFLDLMKQNHITPDIQTFTLMLEVIPPTNAAEKQILKMIRQIGLKADIDFFNILIKKRAMRFDYEGAQEVLSMIRTAGLESDIVTYGVLALGCRTQEEARDLLQQMYHKGVRMNIQILGAMLRQGCAQRAFPYVCEIMQISLDEKVKPNDKFLTHLHNFYKNCARSIDARHPGTKTKNYRKQHAKFCDKLRLYYEEHGLTGLKLEDAIKAVRERPYQQYKEDMTEGLEPSKNDDFVKRQKIRKYIKKIKVDNLKDDTPPSTQIESNQPNSLPKQQIQQTQET